MPENFHLDIHEAIMAATAARLRLLTTAYEVL